MPPLATDLRRKLEAAIGRETDAGGARAIAETAATAALLRLDVDRADPRPHLTETERKLRIKLRARARQLGDRLRDGRQGIDRLVEACAYEHWHRMLFARYLAENDLLMHPDGYSVSVADCAEFAAEEQVDTWEIAGRYASRVLPQIFRPDDPLLAVGLAAEHRKGLEEILAGLPVEVFRASDSLGWVYQFWQARKKKQVNESEVKIGADELSAVTQLFTEPYMVAFLLQNSLGAWWVGQGRKLPVEMPYLRFEPQGHKGEPAAGKFEGWPKTAKELKVLDPCCGSGHFLVAVFEVLVAFRMAEEGLSEAEAGEAVLRDNLFGLELDPRCVQIAAFSLALEAWKRGGYRPLPPLRVACSGVSVAVMQGEMEEEARKAENDRRKARWMRSTNDVRKQRGMLRLFELFQDAPVLGSLIDPMRGEAQQDVFVADASELRPLLEKVLKEAAVEDAEEQESAVSAQGTAEAAVLLGQTYHLVVTNPPYLTRGKQGEILKGYCEKYFADAKNDLANVFLDRCLRLVGVGGTVQMVMPQNWLFLGSYKKQRERLLREEGWTLLAKLGPGAFETISGEVVQAILLTLDHGVPPADFVMRGIDASKPNSPVEKAEVLREGVLAEVSQQGQLKNPDFVVTLQNIQSSSFLGDYAEAFHGQGTFDTNRFTFCFWELSGFHGGWVRQQSCVSATLHYGGCNFSLKWQDGNGDIAKMMDAWREVGYSSGKWRAGVNAWGHIGIMVNQMGEFPVSIYAGWSFDENAAVVLPKEPANLSAIWEFLSSPIYKKLLRDIDASLKVTCKTLVKIPFDLPHWQAIANEKHPKGLPKPFSDDPTQWIFHGHPCGSVIWDETTKKLVHGPQRTDATVLQVAIARLLGYQWPAETDVALELSEESRHWVEQASHLNTFADDDGIVCIPPVAGELSAAERLRDLLLRAFMPSWLTGSEQTLLTSVGYTNRSLEDYLRNGFFEQHCKLFHHRPFIWQVWDGHKEGFSALINYHRLDHKTLESLTFRYLGDWITRQRDAEKRGEPGASDRLLKAEDLQRRLKLILDGEDPYDIFVRWKPIEAQPIGWNPDLNDGVRLNIRPFMTAEVLRWKPNIKWGKDRGKNPPGAPWGEDRDNDTHLTLAKKSAAREK